MANNYRLKADGSNLSSYKVALNGKNNDTVSNDAKRDENITAQEIASKECSYATRSMAMAQILVGSEIKPNMTQTDYINNLIKQGKIPDKHFYIKANDLGNKNIVVELNSKGLRTKEVTFYENNEIGCIFYNPQTQKKYKAIQTSEGKLHISYDDPTTGDPVCDEIYRSDGSLERNAFYKKIPNAEIPNETDYHVSGIDLPPP